MSASKLLKSGSKLLASECKVTSELYRIMVTFEQSMLNLYAKSWLVVALANFIKTNSNSSANDNPTPTLKILDTKGDNWVRQTLNTR